MAERNTQIDSLKFFLVFLVLVGHCLDINLGLHSNNALFRFIYSFTALCGIDILHKCSANKCFIAKNAV